MVEITVAGELRLTACSLSQKSPGVMPPATLRVSRVERYNDGPDQVLFEMTAEDGCCAAFTLSRQQGVALAHLLLAVVHG